MALESFMFDEAFEFQENEDNGQKYNVFHPPQAERWPPLGAASTEESFANFRENEHSDDDDHDHKHLLEMEKEQERLNSSLMALTSHFAQVQFRLKQIVSAPKKDQEQLLKELEDFAFIGCPEEAGPDDSKVNCISCTTHMAYECYDKRISSQKERQKNLAEHVKMFLEELEKYAAKQKDTKINLFEEKTHYSKSDKNRYIVEQLRTKLNMSTEEFESMSPEEMKNQIDKSMAKLVNPGKAKEQLITQLSTQIRDMESFVTFLRDNDKISSDIDAKEKSCQKVIDKQSTDKTSKQNSTSSFHSASPSTMRKEQNGSGIPAPHTKILEMSAEKRKRLHETSITIMKKALAVLQIFAISQFGCSAKHFEEHMMRKAAATASSAGFQQSLTMLKISVDKIMKIHSDIQEIGGLLPDTDDEISPRSSPAHGRRFPNSRHSSTSHATRSRSSSLMSLTSIMTADDDTLESALKEDLLKIVRTEFAPSLRDLLQHGLCRTVENSVLSTKTLLGCISDKSRRSGNMHAWELFSAFYEMKHGNQFNNQPNVKLSESFGVDLGGTQETPRQSLLTAMHKIKTSHEPRKRTCDSMFRALVCAGLNRKKLLLWIRLVIRCPELVDKHFERWSYLARTGFDDVLAALDKLSQLKFYLPENIAIRHLVKSYNEFGDP